MLQDTKGAKMLHTLFTNRRFLEMFGASDRDELNRFGNEASYADPNVLSELGGLLTARGYVEPYIGVPKVRLSHTGHGASRTFPTGRTSRERELRLLLSMA